MHAPACPSNSQVNKAGKVLRRLGRGERPSVDDLSWAVDTLLAFREAHQGPLTKATMGVRSMVKTEGCQVEVSQRLKRAPTIIDKLSREPTLQLANMQDVGGCRAVLTSIAEVRRVEARLKKRRPPYRYSDYVTSPRSSGYRAVHVVVIYDERRIEVQLRTRVMHEWAITVERLAGRLGEDLKSGRGRPEVEALLRAISQAMALEEQGTEVDAELLSRLDALRSAAAPYLPAR